MQLSKVKRYQYGGAMLILLFALVFSAAEISLSGNEASRFGVVNAIGEQGVFYIENTNFRTVDRVIADSHIYSDKPLPLSFLAGVAHKVIYNVTGISFGENYHLAVYLINLLFGGLCNVALFVLLFRELCTYRLGTLRAKWLLGIMMCLGTWLFSYSVVLNNHTPAALAVLITYLLLKKFARDQKFATALWTGVAAGMAGAMDIPTGLFFGLTAVAGVLILAKRGGKIKAAATTVTGGLTVAVLTVLLNFWAYHTALPLYIAGSGGTFRFVPNPQSALEYFFHTLLGKRGLLSYQPFLCFGAAAMIVYRAKLNRALQISLAGAVALTLFYCFGTIEYGGWAYGFRYLIPVIPLLWLAGSLYVLDRIKSNWGQTAVGAALLWGMFTAYVGAYCPFCVAYEGVRSPEGHMTRIIQSTFGGNLLAWSFENYPDSPLTKKVIDYYGPEYSFWYLKEAYWNLKKPLMLKNLAQSELFRPQK